MTERLCNSCTALKFCQYRVNYQSASKNGEEIIKEQTGLFEKSEIYKAVKQRLSGITKAAKDRGCPFV